MHKPGVIFAGSRLLPYFRLSPFRFTKHVVESCVINFLVRFVVCVDVITGYTWGAVCLVVVNPSVARVVRVMNLVYFAGCQRGRIRVEPPTVHEVRVFGASVAAAPFVDL